MASLLSILKENISVDSIGRKRDGTYIFRQGFFYKHHITHQIVAERISRQLDGLNRPHSVVDSGEHWTAFRGGATVANSSHWWVQVRFEDVDPNTKG